MDPATIFRLFRAFGETGVRRDTEAKSQGRATKYRGLHFWFLSQNILALVYWLAVPASLAYDSYGPRYPCLRRSRFRLNIPSRVPNPFLPGSHNAGPGGLGRR
jgi:hypothetical protein